jgi:hypothetical protein
MTAPSEFGRVEPSTTFNMGDHLGLPMLIIVGGYHHAVPTERGVKPAASFTAVILAGPAAGAVFDDVMLFSQACRQLAQAEPGRVLVTKVLQKGRAYEFDHAGVSAYDESLARAWRDQTGQLEDLKAAALQAFTDQAKRIAERGVGGAPVSPQFVPPNATVTPSQPPQPSPVYAPSQSPQSSPVSPSDTFSTPAPPDVAPY